VKDELTAPLEGNDEGSELDLPTVKLSRAVVTSLEPEPTEITMELTKDALPVELQEAALPFGAGPAAPKSDAARSTIAQLAIPQSAIAQSAIAQSPIAQSVVLDSSDVVAVATVAARITAASLSAVLAQHGLEPETWIAIERQWADRLATEAEGDETALRDAYDDAYLAARVAHRGAFGMAAVAELRAELEARIGDESVPALAMDVADAMRFQRVRARRSLKP
jgi:hypothetical protein